MGEGLIFDSMEVEHHGSSFTLSYLLREGKGEGIFYLHGLGSSKHDARLLMEVPEIQGRPLLSFDFPGCGRSSYNPAHHLSVEDLSALAIAVADRVDWGSFALIGHSLGGAAGLLLASRYSDRVKRFINIEGNLAAEDCFFSRESAELTFEEFGASGFLNRIEQRFRRSNGSGDRIFADTFQAMVEPRAFHNYTRSLTKLSDTGDLMKRFQSLEIPRAFIHGYFNAGLSYLERLRESGIRVVEAPDSGHWPMYDHPDSFARLLSSLLCAGAQTASRFPA